MKNNKINISGIAHIAINVKDLKRSYSFYKKILLFLGLKLVHKSKKSFYFIGGKTAILVQQADSRFKDIAFSQKNVGLHHFCFRAKSREDIDKLYKKFSKIDVNIVRGPLNGSWAPGYYYILFEDPDGIRLEVNYVPKKGVFEKNVSFNPSGDY